MQSLLLGSYILIWPVASLAVLAVILFATLRDIRAARRSGHSFV